MPFRSAFAIDLKLRKLARLEEVRIKAELDDLGKERKSLQLTLGSRQRLKTLVRKELEEDAKIFGDDRCSPLTQREEAKAIDETDLMPTEPVTVILSSNGWARSAKGHDIDPETLNYRSGDSFKAAVCGRSNQSALFLDSTGRCYSIPVHQLPSARSLGEPVASRLNPPEGASFEGVMLGVPDDIYLLGSSAGYGFLAKLEDLHTRNKNGKAVITVPKGGTVMIPSRVTSIEENRIAAVSSSGRLLVIQASELPLLAKGKGLKIINIPSARFKSGEEYVVAIIAVPQDCSLNITAGQRKLLLKPAELEKYAGERGRRGNMLPRGYRNVSRLSVSGI